MFTDLFSPVRDKTTYVAYNIPEELDPISMLYTLANGDISKSDDVLDMNYVYCLNWLLYLHHKNKYEEKMMKQNRI